jgi:hypothetical protein
MVIANCSRRVAVIRLGVALELDVDFGSLELVGKADDRAPSNDVAHPRPTARLQQPKIYLTNLRNRRAASSSVSSRLQKQNRTTRSPRRGSA